MHLFKLVFLIGIFQISAQQGYKAPNVLFIISDDLTTTAVSAYENKTCNTPHIDKLASQGVIYTRAYAQFPVCGPSRASLWSGYYPHATKTFGYTSGREHIGAKYTLPQLFKQNGYYTARVSKIFHMDVPLHIEEGSDGADDEASWTERFNSQGNEWRMEGAAELVQNNPNGTIERKGGNVMTIVKANGDDLLHSDAKTAQKACALIKAHKNEPFFLAVGFVRPHVPFVAPSKFFEAYPYQNITLPKKVENAWSDIPKAGINYVTSINAEMTSIQEQKAIAAYYASVAFMDEQVGKVLKTLEDEGLADNTIVIFTSDHGFHLGEHSFWMKVSLREESVRVPLIIKVPGIKPARCNSFVELLDLYPTLAQLTNLKMRSKVQGKSLVKTLKNPQHKLRKTIFSVSQNGNAYLLRNAKWAYIQYQENASGGIELYNMIKDPNQYVNLAQNPKYTAIVKAFKKELVHKLNHVRDNDL